MRDLAGSQRLEGNTGALPPSLHSVVLEAASGPHDQGTRVTKATDDMAILVGEDGLDRCCANVDSGRELGELTGLGRTRHARTILHECPSRPDHPPHRTWLS
jgi:hypothetical protein